MGRFHQAHATALEKKEVMFKQCRRNSFDKIRAHAKVGTRAPAKVGARAPPPPPPAYEQLA